MTPHKHFYQIDRTADPKAKRRAALQSALSLCDEALYRINGAGILLGVAGVPHDAPSIVELRSAVRALKEATLRVSELDAASEPKAST